MEWPRGRSVSQSESPNTRSFLSWVCCWQMQHEMCETHWKCEAAEFMVSACAGNKPGLFNLPAAWPLNVETKVREWTMPSEWQTSSNRVKLDFSSCLVIFVFYQESPCLSDSCIPQWLTRKKKALEESFDILPANNRNLEVLSRCDQRESV